ncbi:MAG TPA: hydrogenase maturation protease [Candidatus Limnocylindria bacterium]
MERTGSRREGPRFAVLGLGNRIQGDEALGAIVVERLHGELPASLAGSVELIDGGTVGLGLLPYLEDLDGLVVVDVVDHAAAPGSLVDMEIDPLRPAEGPMGVHELGAAELLGALLITGRLPRRVRVIGLQPDRIGMGTELSPALACELPDLLTTISERLTAWAAEIGSESGAMR